MRRGHEILLACGIVVWSKSSQTLQRPFVVASLSPATDFLNAKVISMPRRLPLRGPSHHPNGEYQGVDIQLKILQTLISLITNFPAVHGRLLANVRP